MADITKANEKISAWHKNLDRLKNGEFGEMSDEITTYKTLLNYWKAQAEVDYPLASENVKYFEDMVRKEEGITFDYPPCTCLILRKKGRKHTEEHKQKISEGVKRSYGERKEENEG